MKEQYDSEKIYCRRLGHHLHFHYCRLEKGALPCSLIADCWFERIPIDDFLKDHYTKEELAGIFSPQQQKISTIYDLIEKAKNREKQQD